MSAFGTDALDWRRPDVLAIVQFRGIGCVTPADHATHRSWLERHGYSIVSIDCNGGSAALLGRFNELFRWEEEFGYLLGPDRANLNAIRDGFHFEIPPDAGVVLELTGLETMYWEDVDWANGLLAIASEHSAYQLAVGRRFFCLLVLEKESRIVGAVVDSISVPSPFWSASGRLPG